MILKTYFIEIKLNLAVEQDAENKTKAILMAQEWLKERINGEITEVEMDGEINMKATEIGLAHE